MKKKSKKKNLNFTTVTSATLLARIINSTYGTVLKTINSGKLEVGDILLKLLTHL